MMDQLSLLRKLSALINESLNSREAASTDIAFRLRRLTFRIRETLAIDDDYRRAEKVLIASAVEIAAARVLSNDQRTAIVRPNADLFGAYKSYVARVLQCGTATHAESVSQSDSRHRILIIDDDEFDSDRIKVALQNFGDNLNIQVVNNPNIALQTIEAYQPNLTLLDLSMPTVSGFELLRQIVDTGREMDNDIVVLTGSTLKEDMAFCVRMGAHDYKTKPYSIEGYAALARELVERIAR
jgi:CheY-like chemotaxis protein